MSDQWAPAPSPRRYRHWLRRLPWIAGGLFVFLVLLYFFVTSHTFLKMFVVPKVASGLGASVTIGDSSISPFRKVVLREVKIGGGAFEEPVITAREIRARYSLFDILGGNINVDEVTIVSPVVDIIQLEDGTTNLDPLLKKSDDAPPSTEPSQPAKIDVSRFTLTNALVRYTKYLPRDGREIAELSDLSISAANFANGGAATINLAAAIRFDRTPGRGVTNITAERIAAKLAGEFEVGLTADLKPESLRGSTTVNLLTPPAAARDIKGTIAVLECDLTPTELRQFTLTFKQGDSTLGQIKAKGPLDVQRKEGRINLEISSIGRHALNLVGAATGLDFGSTTLNSTQQITIANGGQRIVAAGRLNAGKLSIVQNAAVTRPMDLTVEYDVALDQEKKSALIQQFTLAAAQDGTPVIQGRLNNPMRLDLSGGTNLLDSSSFNLQMTNFNLGDWRAFIGDIAGTASGGLNITATNAGKQLALQLDSRVANLAAAFGSNKIQRADLDLSLRGVLDEMRAFRVDDFLLHLGRDAQPALTLVVSAKGDHNQKQTDATLKLEADLPRLTNILAVAGVPAGTLKLDTQLHQRGHKFHVTNFVAHLQQGGRTPTTLRIDGFYDSPSTNAAAVIRLQSADILALARTNPAPGKPLSLDLTLDAGLEKNVATVRNLVGKIGQAGRPGGSFAATGHYSIGEQSGTLALNLTDVTEAALAPFIDLRALEARGLKSWLVNLKANAQYRSDEVLVENFSADLMVANAGAGQIRAAGKYHLKNKSAEGTLKIADLNQRMLAPLAAAALTNKQLTSVSINVDIVGRYDPARDASVKGEISVSNLLLSDAKSKTPQTPLSVGLEVNTTLAANKLVNIETFRLKLAPTPRARNELQLSGKVDLARTNVFSGDLQLFADSLDLTSYYDLFTATPADSTAASRAPPPTAPTPSPGATAPPREPDAMKLPFDKFNLAVNFGQFYLREIAIQNWQLALAIEGSRARINPLQLALNGVPVKGALACNLGVPGYEYDLSLSGNRIPLAPIADTFAPQQKGKIKGDLILESQIKGAGITGRSLQKNLAGNFALSVTNAHLQFTGGRLKAFFGAIGFFIGVPDLAESPISSLAANARIGNGVIKVSPFNVVSESFTADTQGDIKIADIVANSPIEKWPMHLWLRRALAQRIGKIPRNTAPEAEYVKMPDFVRVAGTVGTPKPELNRMALAGAVVDKLLDNAVKDQTGGLNPLNPTGK
jgi:hypothetical protein